MGYKIPLSIVRQDNADHIKALPGISIEDSELNYTAEFVWEFIRDKTSVPVLVIDPNLTIPVICVMIARFARYYKVVTLGNLVISSTFVDYSVGLRV
jgi:hypothetical protein